jgi:UDP-N-acetylglucosamine 4-epimerase
MKFLITGGAGSVGRDLTSALLTLGHEVRVLDAKVDPAGIPGHANLELVEGRVEDVAVVGKAEKF